MNISLLREFIVSVPTCRETESCSEVWRQFQQTAATALLVVNADQRPLGLLRLERFICLFGDLLGDQSELALPLQDWLADYSGGLEPVETLSDRILLELLTGEQLAGEQLTGEQLANQTGTQKATNREASELAGSLRTRLLRPETPVTCLIVVNRLGRALGQLDKLRLLQHLLQIQSVQPPAQPLQHLGPPRPSHRSAQPKSSGSRTAQRSTRTPTEPVPHPLLDLLERLPLPLMLQTATGHIISQNLAWRQQVGAIQHPQQIRRAAAQILETVLSCRTDQKPSDSQLADWESYSASDSWSERSAGPGSSGHLGAGHLGAGHLESGQLRAERQGAVCQFGTEPNTCVCVCPMQNGQERVWQFIKIPMGTAAVEPQAAESGPPESAFKLASLKFSPTPNWQNLMQTAQLWLIWAQDVTEQQQVAKELAARNADLIQLNRLKDEFLACISHELKTPLTAVLGMSSLLKDHLIGDLNERQSHYAQLIYRGGRHLIAIVNNILDLTRTETGQLELLLEQIHIPTLCQQAFEQSRQILEADGTERVVPALNFQLEVQPALRYIVADEVRLRQMLMNLLSNALKFTEPGQPLGLRVESWGGWIAFTVWDSGQGIPAEKQHLIFQKFQQLEDPMTRQFQGTGLGLVLTQQLARLHGGEVTFTSVVGQGSQFTLLLPPVPPQASAANFDLEINLGASPAPNRNGLALIVEADAEQLQERMEQLNELGYRPVVARSGMEAVEKARRLQPAVILLNPDLPQLSGWDVLTLLKADSSTQAIPLLVTAVRVQKDQAYQHGADGFLSLPLAANTLQRSLERLIHVTTPTPPSSTDLTVLHLSEGLASLTLVPHPPTFAPDLGQLLHPYHCRVLEVDDLEQADLLVRVWKPDVVLLDQIQTEPPLFIQQLKQTTLAKLPLITLDSELARAANQVGLVVFHYALPEQLSSTPNLAPSILTELVQIMQLAAGQSWGPQVLIADCTGLDPQPNAPASHETVVRPPIRALGQYLQTAGFRSTISQDWGKIRHKLSQQTVDLLLLCVSAAESPAVIEQIVQTLENIAQRPPILVWGYQAPLIAEDSTNQPQEAGPEAVQAAQPAIWQPVADLVLPDSASILELLAAINRILAERRQRQLKPTIS